MTVAGTSNRTRLREAQPHEMTGWGWRRKKKGKWSIVEVEKFFFFKYTGKVLLSVLIVELILPRSAAEA